MDKFGIFKLLNSFLNYYEQNKSSFAAQNASPINAQTSAQNGTQSTAQSGTQKNGLADLLSGIFKNQTAQNSTLSPTAAADMPTTTTTPKNKTVVPLQSSMLYTMNSHDEFIKRVKQNNK